MMKRTYVDSVPDKRDQEIAQIVHRVGVTRVTIEYDHGGLVYFQPVEDPDQHLYENLSCPDCGTMVYWSEDQLDYVHEHTEQAKRCWLNRNVPKHDLKVPHQDLER